MLSNSNTNTLSYSSTAFWMSSTSFSFRARGFAVTLADRFTAKVRKPVSYRPRRLQTLHSKAANSRPYLLERACSWACWYEVDEYLTKCLAKFRRQQTLFEAYCSKCKHKPIQHALNERLLDLVLHPNASSAAVPLFDRHLSISFTYI